MTPNPIRPVGLRGAPLPRYMSLVDGEKLVATSKFGKSGATYTLTSQRLVIDTLGDDESGEVATIMLRHVVSVDMEQEWHWWRLALGVALIVGGLVGMLRIHLLYPLLAIVPAIWLLLTQYEQSITVHGPSFLWSDDYTRGEATTVQSLYGKLVDAAASLQPTSR